MKINSNGHAKVMSTNSSEIKNKTSYNEDRTVTSVKQKIKQLGKKIAFSEYLSGYFNAFWHS